VERGDARDGPHGWRRWRWLVLGIAGFAGFWLLALAGNSLGRYLGWFAPAASPEALAERLRPFYRIATPAGSGPFPTALLFSGCDGPHDSLDRWSAMLTARGWAAVVVDSHGPRRLGEREAWRLVCAGQLLMGSERAADVLVALEDVRGMIFADPARMALVGASHGGWAIMELLVFAAEGRTPFGLDAAPDGPGLDGVAGVILAYPYCGAANRARRTDWAPVPVLFLLAGEDLIAPADDCLAVAARMEAAGAPVEVRLFEGVTHGFDQEERAAFSMLVFDPEATAEALATAAAFLDRVAAQR
jgi:dienelactone hydrolase